MVRVSVACRVRLDNLDFGGALSPLDQDGHVIYVFSIIYYWFEGDENL
jgi:hypothetical protein